MKRSTVWMGAAMVAGLATTAFAHPGHSDGTVGGAFAAGATHPVAGLDHLLAAVASGLLAVRVGTKRALWIVPLSFVGLMLAGGAIAGMGVGMPGAEFAIAASVIVLGLLVAAMPKVPLGVAGMLVGAFALCHGHAHVTELGGNSLLPFAGGFAMTTALLHVAAIAIGMGMVKWQRPTAVRFAGAAVAAGFAFALMI